MNKSTEKVLPAPEALMQLDHPMASKFAKFWTTYQFDPTGAKSWIEANPKEAQELRAFVQKFGSQFI
jgi:hypothetical protein